MAKKVLHVVFTIECLVLAVLLCREWTVFYIGGGHSETEYQRVYRDKIDEGHHPVTADIDAGTTSFIFWWGGTICIFVGVALGGPFWAYEQLWPERAALPREGLHPRRGKRPRASGTTRTMRTAAMRTIRSATSTRVLHARCE